MSPNGTTDGTDHTVSAATTEGVDLSVWNIIRSHLQEDLGAERPTGTIGEDQDNVQQIIYVTYEENSSAGDKVKKKKNLYSSTCYVYV